MILDPSAPAERRLVDPRLGLITAVVRHQPLAGIPPAWVGYWTHVARTDVYAPWLADEYGFGAAIGDLERARRAAVGEAVERYCGNIVPSTLTIDSFDGLSSAGRKAIDPRDVALYSREQYATPGFPFTPLTCDLDVAWVAGTDLRTGEETLAPASLVYLDYFRVIAPASPPPTRSCTPASPPAPLASRPSAPRSKSCSNATPRRSGGPAARPPPRSRTGTWSPICSTTPRPTGDRFASCTCPPRSASRSSPS